MSMEVGVEFSQYRVIEHIGRGGMADVWSAKDKRLNRTVAIKTVARDLSQDMNPVRLFEREAKTIASLEHPHILPIYEFGEYEGQLYIVMRYVSGGSLEDLLEDGPMNVEEVLRLARMVAHALDYAHSNKVIHLDLKPSNILLDSYRQPYLADFGLAAVLGPEGRAANPGSGTLLYMAPEQLTSDQLDHRADIYSFAVMVFHMLTGQLPFDATVPLALKQIQLNEALPAIDKIRRDLPAQFTVVLRRGTEVEPGKRPTTLTEVVQMLETALEKPPAAAPLPSARPAERRTTVRPDDMDTATARMDSELLSGALDNLITRSQPQLDMNTDLDALISGPADGLITGPKDRVAGGERTTRLDISGVDDFSAVYDLSPEAMAMREAVDIYNRALRAWLHGQGRFLLGITHFMLINDYYLHAEANNLTIDQSGKEMMLRGALEYDQDIQAWWAQLDDDSRRKVCLHAVRSENPTARIRALDLLEELPDSDPPQIARIVAQGLQTEANQAAQIAAIQVLEKRARFARAAQDTHENKAVFANLLTTARHRLQLSTPSDWRKEVFGSEIDDVLATLALDASSAATRERAARAIGRIRSEAAIEQIAERQRKGDRGALRALAFIRDEAPQLPASVSNQARIYAWLDNTWRRLSEHPMSLVYRYISAAFFAGVAFWGYAYSQIDSASIFFIDRWGTSISSGATVGLFVGLAAFFAGAVVERLRGFWHWWARLILSVVVGYVIGYVIWWIYTYLFLRYAPEPGDMNLYYGALGFALAFVLRAAFGAPGWLSALVAALSIYLPILITWEQFLPPLIYTRPNQHINDYAILMSLLMGIGAYFPVLIGEARAGLRWLRDRMPTRAKPQSTVTA